MAEDTGACVTALEVFEDARFISEEMHGNGGL